MGKKNVKVLGRAGENNYVQDVPFLIPDENMKWFEYMKDCSSHSVIDYSSYGNTFEGKIYRAVVNGIKKAINESGLYH